MTRLLLDQGLPRSAVMTLQNAGWNVIHTFDSGLSHSTDHELLKIARGEKRIIVTLDADFHAILAVENADSPSVIRIRQEGLRGENLAELLLTIWPKIAEQIEAGALVTVTENALRIRRLPIIKNAD